MCCKNLIFIFFFSCKAYNNIKTFLGQKHSGGFCALILRQIPTSWFFCLCIKSSVLPSLGSCLWFALAVFLQARQQQAELAQQEWLQMQQAAQQAQMAAASASAAQQAGSSQDEDEEDDMWPQRVSKLVRIPSWDSFGAQISQCCHRQRHEMCLTAGIRGCNMDDAHWNGQWRERQRGHFKEATCSETCTWKWFELRGC